MAPLRRYLRITKHSVLEVRIYMDRPSDAETWLLRRDDPALPRVIQAVRPLVLPKLREEFERARARSGAKARKKGVKDVVVEDDFEVSIFLTDLSSRHSVLTKQKVAKEKPRIQSNSGKLTGWLTTGAHDKPINVTDEQGEPSILREEDDEVIHLSDVPEAEPMPASNKRDRGVPEDNIISSDSDSNDSLSPEPVHSRKRTRRTDQQADSNTGTGEDDKKKLGLTTNYDGFSIYGRILCLIVKRKGPRTNTGSAAVARSSQKMLESWVSTQAAAEQMDDDDDNG